MILASMDRCESHYRICNADGDIFPSADTKLHRPSARNPGFAACSSRIELNDDDFDYDLSKTDGVCQRCVPRENA
jgi:hypothetical protein